MAEKYESPSSSADLLATLSSTSPSIDQSYANCPKCRPFKRKTCACKGDGGGGGSSGHAEDDEQTTHDNNAFTFTLALGHESKLFNPALFVALKAGVSFEAVEQAVLAYLRQQSQLENPGNHHAKLLAALGLKVEMDKEGVLLLHSDNPEKLIELLLRFQDKGYIEMTPQLQRQFAAYEQVNTKPEHNAAAERSKLNQFFLFPTRLS